MGGLAIWGVDARKGPDGIDCAQGPPKPIADIERFQSEARTLAGQLLMPRHDGVSVDSIPACDPPGSGYLLVLVERSERRPHRCEAAGEKQYFKRAGDSTFAMEHYDIEDAFKRFAAASLEVVTDDQRGPSIVNGHKGTINSLFLVLSIKNTSPITAKFPYLNIIIRGGAQLEGYGLDGNGRLGLPDGGAVDGWQCFLGGANQVIHPGQKLPITRLRISRCKDRDANITIQGSNQDSAPEAICVSFVVQYGCEHCRMQERCFEFSWSEIEALFRKYVS